MKNQAIKPYKQEILEKYVEEKMENVRLELILDNFFMSTNKDRDWEEKHELAQKMYKESKDILLFLTHEFYKEFYEK